MGQTGSARGCAPSGLVLPPVRERERGIRHPVRLLGVEG
jgi:hypothetical protein